MSAQAPTVGAKRRGEEIRSLDSRSSKRRCTQDKTGEIYDAIIAAFPPPKYDPHKVFEVAYAFDQNKQEEFLAKSESERNQELRTLRSPKGYADELRNKFASDPKLWEKYGQKNIASSFKFAPPTQPDGFHPRCVYHIAQEILFTKGCSFTEGPKLSTDTMAILDKMSPPTWKVTAQFLGDLIRKNYDMAFLSLIKFTDFKRDLTLTERENIFQVILEKQWFEAVELFLDLDLISDSERDWVSHICSEGILDDCNDEIRSKITQKIASRQNIDLFPALLEACQAADEKQIIELLKLGAQPTSECIFDFLESEVSPESHFFELVDQFSDILPTLKSLLRSLHDINEVAEDVPILHGVLGVLWDWDAEDEFGENLEGTLTGVLKDLLEIPFDLEAANGEGHTAYGCALEAGWSKSVANLLKPPERKTK